jgi:hypothetical protein
MGNIFGSKKTYLLKIEDKTSERYKNEDKDKREIYFGGSGSGGKWWDIFFCGIFRSVYEEGPSLEKKVEINETFGLIEKVDKEEVGIDGLYSLDENKQGLKLKKFIDGKYIEPFNNRNKINKIDKIDKIDQEELKKIDSEYYLTRANGSERQYAIYLTKEGKIGILRC